MEKASGIFSDYVHWAHDPSDVIECRCGCGGTMPRIDRFGRARSYIMGHQTRKHPDERATATLLVVMKPGERAALDAEAKRLGISRAKVLLNAWRERRAAESEEKG